MKKCLVLILTATLSTSILAACDRTEKVDPTMNKNEITNKLENQIQKHESVDLPVIVYQDSKYGLEKNMIYTQNISKIEMKDFDEKTEIEFFDFYGQYYRSRMNNLGANYKLLVITMNQEVNVEGEEPFEAHVLQTGSGLVIGDLDLAYENSLIEDQFVELSMKWSVGSTSDKTKELLIAIPNEYAKDPNLQLRVVQEIDEEKKYIYIDLN